MTNLIYCLKFTIAFLSITIFQTINAQEFCKTHELHESLYNNNYEYRNNYNLLQRNILNSTIKLQSKINSRAKINYLIPVVIHIVTAPGTAIGTGNNLTDLEVEQGLSYLNEAFSNTGNFKTNNGVDVEIQFCLAVRDPSGLPTSGITRTESNLVADPMPCSPYGTSSANDGAIKQLVNWDCRQYLNVWLVTDLYDNGFGCGLAGYAYFPGAPCTVDGVVQEGRYWNSIGGTRVTAHEIGHYLSLNHTFNGGCINNNCLMDGDQVCDTPPDGSPSFAPCNTNSCNTDNPDLPDDNTNYMDYTSCLPMHFTQGQKVRMIAGLENGRKSLITSQACIPVVNIDGAIQSLGLPYPICETDVCPEITWKNVGLLTLTSTIFEIQYDNNPKTIFNWTGNLSPNSSIKIKLPCEKLSIGNHIVKINTKNTNGSSDGYAKNDSSILAINILSKPKLSVSSITGTHCISDGSVKLNCINGTIPYLYQLLPLQYVQNLNYFNLLSSGNYDAIVTDANQCMDTIAVVIPDSCKSSTPKNFITNKDAVYQGNDCYRLTQAIQGQVGSIWYDQKIDLNQSFDVVFDINLGCIDGNGADGIAFMLQPLSTSIGISGGGLGYAGVSPSIAVEFDTYQNCCSNSTNNTPQDGNDPAQDHMAIMKNGTVNHLHVNNLAGPVDILNGRNAEDCNFHPVRISWNARTKKFDCYVDCILKLSYTGDIINTIFSGNPNVYFGFTAATGGSINVQQVCFKFISFLDKLEDQVICKGSTIQIAADDDFTSYSWTPNTGINNPNIRNPLFSPSTSTNYIVVMKDACGFTVTDTVLIEVVELNIEHETKISNPCSDSISADIFVKTNPVLPNTLYSIDGINFSSTDTFFNLRKGTHVLYAKNGKCTITKFIEIKENKKLQDSLIAQNAVRCNQLGMISIQGIGGYSPYTYKIDNDSYKNDGYFPNLDSGIHILTIRDSLGCETQKEIHLAFLKQKLKLQIIDSNLTINCLDSNTFISLKASGTEAFYHYKLDLNQENILGIFEQLKEGNHTIVALDEFGCVSDTLFFKVNNYINHKNANVDISICEGDFHQVGQNKYYNVGLYIDTLTTADFCDSIINTNLSYFRKENIKTNIEICEGSFYKVASSNYSKTGTYLDTLKNIYGCDSIINTDLFVHPRQYDNDTIQICDGSFYKIGNNSYSLSGTYIDTLVNIKGCDSIVTTNLLVNPRYAIQNNQTICDGEFIKVGANSYSIEGSYIDTLFTVSRCDSIIISNLKVNPISRTALTKEICENDFFQVGNKKYLIAGNYIDTLQNIHQCDSIINLNLIVNFNTSQLISKTSCENIPLEINNEIYYRSGRFVQLLKNTKNCDSTLSIDVNMIDTQIVLREFILCRDDSVMIGNNQYKVAGRYTDILNNIYGCDSTVKSLIIQGDDFYCDSLHCRVYIPNVFSPNGDNVNDEFQFFSPVLEINYLAIYDRWGELLYESKENNPKWNGRDSKDNLILPGVYVYLMRASCSNGKQVKKVGEISLIR